jgi:Mg-chelatase subunit ChlD
MALGFAQARAALKASTGAQKVYVLLTDGHPDDPEGTVEECHRIRRTGGRIITIGIGRQVHQNYLQSICSTSADYHHCDQSVELEGTFINLATELSDGA